MIFERIYDEGLAQASYVLGCTETNEAIVIDPRRDIWVYLDWARENGMTIKAVAETHIHADFLSGGRELAQAVSARLYISGESPDEWAYRGLDGVEYHKLKDGEQIKLGDVVIQAIHTPGHTPEHMSFLTYENQTPHMFFTGDYLFVGDTGRPDLLSLTDQPSITNKEAAGMMYESLQKTVQDIPEYVLIWPGHGAGSACGKSMDDLPATTLGHEFQTSWWGRHIKEEAKEAFIQELLDEQPEAPTYFARMKKLNRDGMSLHGRELHISRLSPHEFHKRSKEQDAILLDTREWTAFAEGHIKDALSLPAGASVSTFGGWILDPEKRYLLLGSPEDAARTHTCLLRVGIENVMGYIRPEDVASKATTSLSTISIEDAHTLYQEDRTTFIDVRSESEYKEGHVEGAQHIHYGRIQASAEEISTSRTLVTYCASGTRATLAAAQLQRMGFDDVRVMGDGYPAWADAEHPTKTTS